MKNRHLPLLRLLTYTSFRSRMNAGFTLVELLVAMALTALILVMMLRLTTNTMEISQSSNAKIQGAGDLRGALDRMSADFSLAIFREDLPPLFLKNENVGEAENDAFQFFATTEGYSETGNTASNRRVSRIGYRIRDGRLERGASASGWEDGKSPWDFDPATGLDETHYDVMAPRVFRLELDFLMMDGTLRNSPAPTNWNEVKAVVVTLVTIDERAARRMDGELSDLEPLFPDPPANNHRAVDAWSAQLDDPTLFPGGTAPALPVLQGLQVRQRIFQVNR